MGEIERATSNENAVAPDTPSALGWLDQNWPFAGTVVVAFLITLLPLLVGVWHPALVLVYAQLLIYQLHQIEEHYGDRFRRFVNEHVAHGGDVLTPRATMWINVGLVWAMYLIVLLLAGLLDVGLGLIAVYTTLVNALAHIVGAIALRRYNPGLWTALVLFIPVGGWAWMEVSAANGLGGAAHLVGLATAVGVHAALMVSIRRKLRSIGKESRTSADV